MSTIASKLTAFRSSYSDREFSLMGSALDKSVIGAVEKSKGMWEPHVMNLMAQLISPTDVCLDIGANVGIYTLVMSDLAPKGRIYAFEPASMNFSFLQRNIADNHLLNVASYRVALSNKVGSGYFHYLPDFAGCSFAEDEAVSADPDAIIQAAWGARFARVTEAVEYTTLDLWAAQESLDRVDFVKMDVEGSELFVIQGGKIVFERFRPTLFTEFNAMCLAKYFGLSLSSYFALLRDYYPFICAIQPDTGGIIELATYSDLATLLTPERWWADLLCTTAPDF